MVLDCGKKKSSRTYVRLYSFNIKKIFNNPFIVIRHKAAYAGTTHGFSMQIAVIGTAEAAPSDYEAAYAAGRAIAGNGAVLVCGGLGGVMEAASRGAHEAGGITVGILPGTAGGNPYLDITIPTGLGHARNVLVVLSADAVIAVGGGYGTLSEIAVALKTGRPVYGINTWKIDGVISCSSPNDAVMQAIHNAAPPGTG